MVDQLFPTFLRGILFLLVLLYASSDERVSAEIAGGGSLCDGDWCVPCPPAESATGDLLITPGGSGSSLAELGLTITVTILECDGGGGLPGYPADAVHLVSRGDVKICEGLAIADADTDQDGKTTFSGVLAGGGYGEDLAVALSGVVQSQLLMIRVNSPDINGDLIVDLVDVGLFAQDFSNGSYDFRSDFSHDGLENLSDVGIFARHIGESCR